MSTLSTAFPRGGDAVRIAAGYKWTGAPEFTDYTKVGIINGVVDEEAMRKYQLGYALRDQNVSIIFNYSAFNDGRVCSVSGGPGTIATPIGELVLTDEKVMVNYWKWKDGISGAGRGDYYKAEARVWAWYPNTVIIPPMTAAEEMAELRDKMEKCRRFGDVTDNGVVYQWELAGPGGARYELFREAHHTDKDIGDAKEFCYRSFDVVGISVTRLKAANEKL